MGCTYEGGGWRMHPGEQPCESFSQRSHALFVDARSLSLSIYPPSHLPFRKAAADVQLPDSLTEL